MVETSRRGRVGLGLIGLGPSWEQTYRNVLLRLQNRLTIRQIYDPVEARARSVAVEFDATAVSSLQQMLSNTTLQGLLVLDPGWCGVSALRRILGGTKPVFLAQPVLRHVFDWCSSSDHTLPSNGSAHKQDELLMPELALRFTPASCRLRELIATKLGPATNIAINCDLSDDQIALLIDWCSNILGVDPHLPHRDGTSPESGFELIYQNLVTSFHSTTPRHRSAVFRQRLPGESPLTIAVTCDHGQATLFHRTLIEWSANGESTRESLAEERTETEILIDQFCRRALGGLNPVGPLSDLLKAIQIVQSIRGEQTH